MSRGRSTARKPTQPGHGGKLANDANQTGAQVPTQRNQGRRTPLSRSDRLSLKGADNQTRERKGEPFLGAAKNGA